jgi:hypothetical protein
VQLVETIAKRKLMPTEEVEIHLFEAKIQELKKIKKQMDEGDILIQGQILGTYNGYLCASCSSDPAKWNCCKCKKYFCMDCFSHEDEICEDCKPKCDACQENEDGIELKHCTSCEYNIYRKCDAQFFDGAEHLTCGDCLPEVDGG